VWSRACACAKIWVSVRGARWQRRPRGERRGSAYRFYIGTVLGVNLSPAQLVGSGGSQSVKRTFQNARTQNSHRRARSLLQKGGTWKRGPIRRQDTTRQTPQTGPKHRTRTPSQTKTRLERHQIGRILRRGVTSSPNKGTCTDPPFNMTSVHDVMRTNAGDHLSSDRTTKRRVRKGGSGRRRKREGST